jgi:hypothetical protein
MLSSARLALPTHSLRPRPHLHLNPPLSLSNHSHHRHPESSALVSNDQSWGVGMSNHANIVAVEQELGQLQPVRFIVMIADAVSMTRYQDDVKTLHLEYILHHHVCVCQNIVDQD